MPEFHSVNVAAENLNNKTHIDLSIARWTIQKMLKDVKYQFSLMSQGFIARDALRNCIQKIRDGDSS